MDDQACRANAITETQGDLVVIHLEEVPNEKAEAVRFFELT